MITGENLPWLKNKLLRNEEQLQVAEVKIAIAIDY
jgi:hypothetical protein